MNKQIWSSVCIKIRILLHFRFGKMKIIFFLNHQPHSNSSLRQFISGRSDWVGGGGKDSQGLFKVNYLSLKSQRYQKSYPYVFRLETNRISIN